MDTHRTFLERISSSTPGRYAIALAATGVALLIRWLLEPLLGNDFPFVTLFAAVAFSAIFAGRGPSILATFVSLGAAIYGFMPPQGRPFPAQLTGILTYLFTCALIIETGEMSRRYKARLQRSEEALRENQERLEERVQLRTALMEQAKTSAEQLSRRLLVVQDAERRQVAGDLHERLGQDLAALKMTLEVAMQELGTPEAKAKLLAECVQILDKCLGETRVMSYWLHPPLLDESGFASAARWYAEDFAESTGIKVNLSLPSDLPRLASRVEVALFRALQESLSNVQRHSGSASVDVTIELAAEQMRLQVKDYGRGISLEGLGRYRGGIASGEIGLRGIRERVQEFGGSLEVDSDGSTGTTVTIVIPSPAEAQGSFQQPDDPGASPPQLPQSD